MRGEHFSLTLLTRYRTKFRGFLGEAYTRSWKAKASTQEGAQTHPIALCLVAYLIVERERLDQGCTWRQLKRRLILQGRQLASPALERVRTAA